MGARPWPTSLAYEDQGCEEGFTLVEVMVALAIASLLFIALAYGALASIRASQVARQNQQAADIANQQLEQIRQLSWGSLGHETVSCPDELLVDCDSAPTYGGEPLVLATGGSESQHETVAHNKVQYAVHRYVTKPADDTGDYRRVSVVVTWNDNGKLRSRTAATLVSESTRGLPLPDFKLTPIGTVDAQVNPAATAFWGFRLDNQGAPDQWNIVTSGDITPQLYQDNGDDVFNPSTDTIAALVDSNGDGYEDTGRLDPQGSLLFWAIHEVPACDADGDPDCADVVGQKNFSVTATSASQPGAATASQTVAATLTVTTAIITASPTPTPTATPSSTPTPTASPTPTPTGSAANQACPDPSAASHPDPAPATGFTRIEYTLHNTGNVVWPTQPLPLTGEIDGSTPLKPMAMDLAPDAIPTGRLLPALSLPDATPGRALAANGSFTGGASAVADWVTASQTKTYTGSMVLRTFVDLPPAGSGTVSLTTRIYQFRSSGNKVEQFLDTAHQEQTRTFTPLACEGFQQVSFTFPVSGTKKLGKNYVLGMRMWSSGDQPVRLAYDHEDYAASLTVVEQ